MTNSNSRYFTDEGIVLAAKNTGEADKILTIFTKNFGKLEVLAKNVKKLNSKRASASQVLSHSKFAIARSKVTTLAEAVVSNQFLKIKSNLTKLALAWQALEVLNLLVPTEVAYHEIFEDLLSFLKKLEKTSNFHEAKIKLAAFEIKLLIKTGWLGEDFKVKSFSNFSALEKFLTSKFEAISQRRLKSYQFAKMVVGGSP